MELRPAVLVCVGALFACSKADDGGSPAAVAIDTLPGGIVRVINTTPTLWPDTAGWRLVEERVIQPAEESPGALSDVTKLVADDAGNVFVMQIAPTTIKAFDSTGRWLRDIGREGSGPGEFPDGMLGIRGDTLIVQDPNNQRLTTFLTDGTLIGMARSQCCSFTSSLPVLDDGIVMVMGPAPVAAAPARFAYYLTRTDGTVTDTVVRPAPASNDRSATTWSVSRKSGNTTSTMDIGIPGLPRDQSQWRGDGLQVIGNTGKYTLIIRRGYGDTLRIIEATAPQLLRSDAERDSMYEAAISSQGAPWREAIRAVANIDQIPRNRPPWSALATDREHRIWVGIPGAAAAVATLDVFSPEGILLGKVPAPHPRILEGYWTRDRVYLRDTDDADRPLIRVYRLVTTIPAGS